MTKPWPTTLKANSNCCEEASLLSESTYIPCNKLAWAIVGWIGRNEAPIRMCAMCTDYNVKNKRGEIIKVLVEAVHSNPLDAMSEDQLLMLWDNKKKAIETAKEEEIDLRKYIVGREFPKKAEGTNTKELGNGYQLKAMIKYNYNLADNDTVEEKLNKISSLGNMGPFIADRLVSWKPSFLLTEYRQLCEDEAKGDKFAKNVLNIVNEMLIITEAAPSLNIVEPKGKKK